MTQNTQIYKSVRRTKQLWKYCFTSNNLRHIYLKQCKIILYACIEKDKSEIKIAQLDIIYLTYFKLTF